ncbi:unnamed protein product [Gadus morhua 'NCC']
MPPYPGADGVSAPTLGLREQDEATERAGSVIPGADPEALRALEALRRRRRGKHCVPGSSLTADSSAGCLEVGFQSKVSS